MTMNDHLQAIFEGSISPASLQTLFISPFTIAEFGNGINLRFRETFISIFAADMRIAMYVSVAAFLACLCAWQKNPRTIHQKRNLLEEAKRKYAAQLGRTRLENQIPLKGQSGMVTNFLI
jgi:hypothetical protein